MPITTLQSNLVPLKFSNDAGVTYKSLVCQKGATFALDSPVTREETYCGSHVGLGAVTWGFDFDGVVNITPTGASEVSYEDLLGFASAQTLLYIKEEYPGSAGTDFYHQGTGYITNLQKVGQQGSLITFSGRFEGTSALDVTP